MANGKYRGKPLSANTVSYTVGSWSVRVLAGNLTGFPHESQFANSTVRFYAQSLAVLRVYTGNRGKHGKGNRCSYRCLRYAHSWQPQYFSLVVDRSIKNIYTYYIYLRILKIEYIIFLLYYMCTVDCYLHRHISYWNAADFRRLTLSLFYKLLHLFYVTDE